MSKPAARRGGACGHFPMHTSHFKSRLAEVIPRAKATDMAEMRREGKSLEEVGEALGLSPSTVRSRLNGAGFSSNGKPRKKKKT